MCRCKEQTYKHFSYSHMKDSTNNLATAAHCLLNTSNAKTGSPIGVCHSLYSLIRAHSLFVIFSKYTPDFIFSIIKILT